MLELTVDLSNFTPEDAPHEVRRLLRYAAEHVVCGQWAGTLKDRNGNTVGRWQMAGN